MQDEPTKNQCLGMNGTALHFIFMFSEFQIIFISRALSKKFENFQDTLLKNSLIFIDLASKINDSLDGKKLLIIKVTKSMIKDKKFN